MKTILEIASTSLLVLLTSTQSHVCLAGNISTDDGLQLHLAGHVMSKVVTLFVEDNAASKLLPRGLELAPDSSYPPGKHAVSLLFNQNDINVMLGSVPVPFPHYNEIMFTINSVRRIGDSKSFWYFPKLYLDSIAPILGGRLLGYPKFFGFFDLNGDFMSARELTGEPIISAVMTRKRTYDHVAFESNFEVPKKILTTPIISKVFNGFVCSQFSLDFKNADTYPIESTWEITDRMAKGLSGHYEIPGLDVSPAGGYSMEIDASLVGPISCD